MIKPYCRCPSALSAGAARRAALKQLRRVNLARYISTRFLSLRLSMYASGNAESLGLVFNQDRIDDLRIGSNRLVSHIHDIADELLPTSVAQASCDMDLNEWHGRVLL